MADDDDFILTKNLFFLSRALSRELSSQADEAFASAGLSSSHALILLLVQRHRGIKPGTLAEKLHLKPSTITRLVQKLERRALVEKESHGRTMSINCTEKGTRAAGDVNRQWQQLLGEKEKELGDRYVQVLSEMIAKALDILK